MKIYQYYLWFKTSSLILIFLIFLDLSKTFSYQITGNIIYDLEDNTSQVALTAEAAPWIISLYRTSGLKVSYCAGYFLLGGYLILGGSGTTGPTPYYGQYFKRTYIPPVAHNQINIQMLVYAIDSWDGLSTDDHFEIGIDGVNVYAWRINGFDPIYSNVDRCGDPNWKDFPPFTVYMSYPHTLMTGLELKILSCSDEDSTNESLGLREIKIEFITSQAPSFNLCARGTAPLSSSPCPCQDPNMFMYPPNSGTCVYCQATCATCTGPASTQCTSCYPGRILSGGQCLPCDANCATCAGAPMTCTSCYPGKYLSGSQCLPCDGNCATCVGSASTCTSCNTGWFLVGNTCYPSCNPPLSSYVSNGVMYCKTPCPGQFAYWDGNCGSTCGYASNAAGAFGVYPTTVNTFSICNYPCSSTTEVLYWNGTCSATGCPSPLSTTTFHGSSFCDYQCGNGQFLYWNGSCLNSCPSPLTDEIQGTTLQQKFCWYKCQPNEHLYFNGSCLNSCPYPLTGELQGLTDKRNFCWYTCQPSEYLYWNGSCLSTCPSPLSRETQGAFPFERQFCLYLCQPNEYLYWEGGCRSSCLPPLWPETQGLAPLQKQFCWYPCQPKESLYWNGTCSGKCNYPLSGKVFAGRHFCNLPCPISHYLVKNGSCLTSCPIGFWKNNEYRYCEPCQDPLCATCDLSFGAKCEVCKEQSILDSNSVCKDCQALSSEYIDQNDETYEYQYKMRLWPASCDVDEAVFKKFLSPAQESKSLFPPFGFQVVNKRQDSTGAYFIIKLTFKSALANEKEMNFTLSYLSTAPLVPRTPEKAPTAPISLKTIITIVNTGAFLSGLYLGSTAAFWNLICFQQFIGYFAYMNIIYPKHLEVFLIIFVNTNLEFLPNPLGSLMNRISDAYDSVVDQKEQQELYQLPYKFEALETPTLFIVNAGSTFFLCLIFLVLPYVLGQIRKIKKLENIKILQDLHSDFKWNAIIRMFLESGIPLAFAAFIQIRKVSFANIPFALSTFCTIIAVIYLCWMLHYAYHILINLKFENMKEENVEKSLGTLYEGLILKKDKPTQKYYYLITLLRGILLVCVDVFLEELPEVQILVMIFFNVFFMFYVCKVIEFESKYLTLTTQMAEIFLLIGEILIMTLIPDRLTEEYKRLIGWMIIVLFSIILASQFAYGIYLQILAVIDLIKRLRAFLKKRALRRIAPVVERTLTLETSANILITEAAAGTVTFRGICEGNITLKSRS